MNKTMDVFKNLKAIPFWHDHFPHLHDIPISPVPDEVDVAIVGGGYTGLSAARTLAKSGVSVVVLEQSHIGGGASSVNGGQVAPGLKADVQTVYQTYGPELGRELWDASLEAIRFFEQTIAEEQIDCDYTAAGGIALAYRPTHYRQMLEHVEWMADTLNYEQHLIPPEKLRDEIGSGIYYGGVHEMEGGGIQPAKYVHGLACATVRAGAMLCPETTVQQIRRQIGHSGFYLITNRGNVRAEAVLMATNGYTTGSLVKGIQRRVFPVGSYMITTEPLPPELQRELSPNDRVFYDSKHFLNYFRLTPDGRMSMGGRNNLSPDLDVVDSARFLQQRTVEIFPQLRDVPISHTWSGRLGITFDLMPHIGQVNGIYYAFGYGGHGVALSGYLGQEAAKLMTGQISRSPFAEIPHQTYVFYQKKPWFLPLAASYYRFLDKVS